MPEAEAGPAGNPFMKQAAPVSWGYIDSSHTWLSKIEFWNISFFIEQPPLSCILLFSSCVLVASRKQPYLTRSENNPAAPEINIMASPNNHSALEKRIAEFQQMIESFRKEKEDYNNLFESILFGIQEINTEGIIVYTNAAFNKIHGYKAGEIIGKSILGFIESETEKRDLAAYLEYLVREQPVPTPWTAKNLRKDGSLVDIKAHWNYKRDQEGKVIGFISLIIDITEKKKLQKELLESRRNFQSIFEHSPLAIMSTDADGTVIACNESASKLFGAPKEKLVGFSYKNIKNERVYNAIAHAMAGKKSYFEGEYRTMTGNVLLQMKANFSPAYNEDGSISGVIGIFEDFSERKKVELEIARRKAEFEAMFNSISDAVVFVDQQRRIIMVNKAFTEIFGYRLDEISGKTTQFFYADPGDYQDQGNKRYRIGAPIDSPLYEINYRRKDGSVFPSETMGSEVKDEAGNTIGFLGVMRDITQRKKAELALKESEEKYSKIFNNEIDAIVLFDGETQKIIDANGAFLRLYNYTHEEALQLKAEDISCEPEKTIATIQKTSRGGNLRIKRRVHKKKGGEKIMVNIGAFPIMLQNKKAIFSRIQDITEHVEAEKELRELEERFRIAFHTSPDAISINTMDGTYIEINEGFTELTGYTRKDVIGRSSVDLNIWNNLEDRMTLVQGLREKGTVMNLEADFRMKDGSIKTALMSANIINLYGERQILAITRDITDRIKAEREKEKLETHLRQVYKMEAIGTMAGGIAHDFNNILTIILGNADLARYVSEDDSPASQYIKQIQIASGRAKDMVNQILAFSRRAKQNLVPVRPYMIFSESLKLLRSTIPSSVEIQQDLDTNCPVINADPTQLNQLLMNLCANAVYAMDEKGVLKIKLQETKLSKRDIRHKAKMQPGPFVLLSVTDSGKGMSPEVKERIFDPFFTTKKVGEGTGMGLSVVHGIIESHGGMVSLKSAPGKGTTFNIYFPIIEEFATVTEGPGLTPEEGKEHILLVDDEVSLVELVDEILELHGYRVTFKTSSSEALATFTANPDIFDLVITDQTMPKMTGAELSAALLKIRPDLPIILCTGYSSKISDKMAKEIGIADFSMKPFDMEQLLRSVRKVLDSKKQ
jgi:PAS domain S-box-containing protein